MHNIHRPALLIIFATTKNHSIPKDVKSKGIENVYNVRELKINSTKWLTTWEKKLIYKPYISLSTKSKIITRYKKESVSYWRK
jgi:hypothetical protein